MASPAGYTLIHKSTIDASEVGTGIQTNALIYIGLGDIRADLINGGTYSADNGGGSLLITSDEAGENRLPLHILQFVVNASEASRKCAMFTRYTVNGSTDVDIYFWNKTGESQPAVGAAFGRNATYASYEFFSHDLVTDVTGNYTGAFAITGSPTLITGPFGNANGAKSFSGGTEYITVALGGRNPFSGHANGDPYSMGAWLSIASDGNFYGRAFHVRDNNNASMMIGQRTGVSSYYGAAIGNPVANTDTITNGVTSANDVFEKFVFNEPTLNTTNTSSVTTNATEGSTPEALAANGSNSQTIVIGARSGGTGTYKGAVSAVWFKKAETDTAMATTEFNNQTSSTFMVPGPLIASNTNASGAATAESSSGDGSAVVSVNASGDAVGESPVGDGSADVVAASLTASGAVNGESGVGDGAANVSSLAVTASGAVSGGNATGNGSGLISLTAFGSPSGQPGIGDGSGIASIAANGSPSSEEGAVVGLGAISINASGSPSADQSIGDGSGVAGNNIAASGNPSSDFPIVIGQANIDIIASGDSLAQSSLGDGIAITNIFASGAGIGQVGIGNGIAVWTPGSIVYGLPVARIINVDIEPTIKVKIRFNGEQD